MVRRLVTAALIALAPPTSLSAQSAAVFEQASANGITIAYRTAGARDGRPLVLLPGTGMQAIEWPAPLVEGLVRRGFRVVMPEMRDSGASTHFTNVGAPDWAAILPALGAGREPTLAYHARDMAKDVIALMDTLEIERADIMGISGGATIGELVAIAAPARVRSLALIAANSGNRAIPLPAEPKAFEGQAQPRPDETNAEMIARRVDTARRLAGLGGAFDPAAETALARQAIARDADQFGAVRQGVAMLATGDLRQRLSTITAPTVVIHGAIDPLIAVQAGREVADAIPGATFLTVDGMGHALPPAAIPRILNAVKANAKRRSAKR